MSAPAAPGALAGDAGRGILWMLLTMLIFASINALAKQLTLTYPVPQVVWARYAFHMVLLLVLLRGRLPRMLASVGHRASSLNACLRVCSNVPPPASSAAPTARSASGLL